MLPPLLLIGHDELRLQATSAALALGHVLNPVVACTDIGDLTGYLLGRAPYDDRTAHPLPAVVVTELRLSDGDAADVLTLVRRHLSLRRVPVIVVSDRATEQEIDQVHQLGAAAYLDRRVAADVLVGVIRDTDIWWTVGAHRPSSGVLVGEGQGA